MLLNLNGFYLSIIYVVNPIVYYFESTILIEHQHFYYLQGIKINKQFIYAKN